MLLRKHRKTADLQVETARDTYELKPVRAGNSEGPGNGSQNEQ
ncbi:hypothetical protein BH09BAC4_BH09BAC4_15340 [soil metagenome]